MIRISGASPIRFRRGNQDDIEDYDFFIEKNLCFMQKYNIEDLTKLQIISDDEEPFLTVHVASTNRILQTIYFSEIPTLIADDEFKIFELEIQFAQIGTGEFYFKLSDGSRSGVISVMENHKDTILIKYRNSKNGLGVVFDTGILFQMRIDAFIRNFSPKSDDEIYNDQLRNSTKLYSLPYNVFTFFAGNSKGLPDYILDTINIIFSCDMIKLNDRWFEKVEGSEWEVKRIEGYDFSGMSIDIMPAVNRIAEQIKIDEENDLNPEEYMIIQRYSNNYADITGSISLNDVMKKNTVLNYIQILRKGLPYTVNIGLTAGGSEIGSFLIDDIINVITLNYAFTDPQNLYISGLTGANDVSIVWDQVDRFFNPAATGVDPTPQPAQSLGIGAIIEWDGSPSQLDNQFNLVTGLGRDSGDWVGWAICNGNNGTRDHGGIFTIGYKRNDPSFGVLGVTGGEAKVALKSNEQGTIKISGISERSEGSRRNNILRSLTFTADGVAGSKTIDSNSVSGSNVPIPQITVPIGNAVASHNNMPPYIVVLKIQKIN